MSCRGFSIRQHGSAVYVRMAVVVCMLQYKRKVALLLNKAENRQTKLTVTKWGLNSAHNYPYFPAKVRLHVDSALDISHVSSSSSSSSSSLTAVAHGPEGPEKYFSHHIAPF